MFSNCKHEHLVIAVENMKKLKITHHPSRQNISFTPESSLELFSKNALMLPIPAKPEAMSADGHDREY